MAWIRPLLLAVLAAALLCAVAAWRLGKGPADAGPAAGGPDLAALAAPAAAPAPRDPQPASRPAVRAVPRQAQGRLTRERDGQLYEDFPDGRRVLHTTVRMRDQSGREWDEPVEIEATPVDPRRRDEPRR